MVVVKSYLGTYGTNEQFGVGECVEMKMHKSHQPFIGKISRVDHSGVEMLIGIEGEVRYVFVTDIEQIQRVQA